MNIQQNKENAIAFNKMAFEGNPQKAVQLFIGDQYIQHNPVVKDGLEGFIGYFERMQQDFPTNQLSLLEVLQRRFGSITYTSDLV